MSFSVFRQAFSRLLFPRVGDEMSWPRCHEGGLKVAVQAPCASVCAAREHLPEEKKTNVLCAQVK